MKYVIFYSWQSDLENGTNRSFLEKIIKQAVESLKSQGDLELDVAVDRDTLGLLGAPNISQALFDKISKCDAFVADVSIVTRPDGGRLCPNPNVLIELGYAIAELGWENIVLFCNEAYGSGDNLPFDIRQHRRITYTLNPGSEKTETTRTLVSKFSAQLRGLLKGGKRPSPVRTPELVGSWCIPIGDAMVPSVDTAVLQVRRGVDVGGTVDELRNQLKSIDSVDGSCDPKWQKRCGSFKRAANELIDYLSTSEGLRNYFVSENFDRMSIGTLSVFNRGTAPAKNVLFRVEIPDWLVVVDRLPTDVPSKPSVPVPSPPIIDRYPRAYAEIVPYSSVVPMMSKMYSRDGSCYVHNNSILLTSDLLAHKHRELIVDDIFHAVADASAPIGFHTLSCEVFCEEQEDFEGCELVVQVI